MTTTAAETGGIDGVDNPMNENFLFAFGLTLIAGLSTGIGSAIAFFARRTNTKFLSVSLGLSAGVMIYVSFMEMLPEAFKSLGEVYGETNGAWAALAAFFGGMLLIAIIDKFVPDAENPHELHKVEDMEDAPKEIGRAHV